ncbi:hypothetical protein B0H67DRAFT_566379 [Lasiosphaeris hirsuta]|uniref:Uncharacterized protein n=1 Tax=Lasiosphaeris hirsuta TaxID=260670 RepID=A0AA40BD22_9PEZI|nr:hypothetical protein B0H67DRAFT_566379 [Lasiosphaeris hirsuta]
MIGPVATSRNASFIMPRVPRVSQSVARGCPNGASCGLLVTPSPSCRTRTGPKRCAEITSLATCHFGLCYIVYSRLTGAMAFVTGPRPVI